MQSDGGGTVASYQWMKDGDLTPDTCHLADADSFTVEGFKTALSVSFGGLNTAKHCAVMVGGEGMVFLAAEYCTAVRAYFCEYYGRARISILYNSFFQFLRELQMT